MRNRYEKFLLEQTEIPLPPTEGEGLISVHYDISEVEQSENINQFKLIESLYYCICELFEIKDMELQLSFYSNSFFIISKIETAFNSQEGFISPELSRAKLKKGTAMEISGAIIDLLRSRHEWREKRSYNKLHL